MDEECNLEMYMVKKIYSTHILPDEHEPNAHIQFLEDKMPVIVRTDKELQVISRI